MTEKERMELVERILLDQVGEDEQPAVKRLLAEDADLQRELRFQLQLRQAVRKREEAQTRATLRGFDEPPPASRATSGWLRAAAVVTLVLAAVLVAWLLLRDPGPPGIAEGFTRLPLYETQELGLGIGKEGTARGTLPAVFSRGTPAAYQFADTLKIRTPDLPAAGTSVRVVYERSTDTYYLIVDEDRYELVRGLRGEQPLRKAGPATGGRQR